MEGEKCRHESKTTTVDINILCHLISVGARVPKIGARVTVWFLMIIF